MGKMNITYNSKGKKNGSEHNLGTWSKSLEMCADLSAQRFHFFDSTMKK